MVTTWTDGDPLEFCQSVVPLRRREDALVLLDLMGRITGQAPRMFGPSIIGFGEYDYRYASGRSGISPAVGFSPRNTATTIYFADGVSRYEDELAKMGPHTTGVGCVYIKDLTKCDLTILTQIVGECYRRLTKDTYRLRARESKAKAAQSATN